MDNQMIEVDFQACCLIFNGPQAFAFVHWYYSIGDISRLCAQRPAQRKKWYVSEPSSIHCPH
jgi:hypothetical protein